MKWFSPTWDNNIRVRQCPAPREDKYLRLAHIVVRGIKSPYTNRIYVIRPYDDFKGYEVNRVATEILGAEFKADATFLYDYTTTVPYLLETGQRGLDSGWLFGRYIRLMAADNDIERAKTNKEWSGYLMTRKPARKLFE